jgi:cytochrome P450
VEQRIVDSVGPPVLEPESLTDLDELDLTAPATHAEHDLGAVWRHLRDHRPLHRHPATEAGPAFWMLTRHADVTAVLRDSSRFTSTSGNVLETLLVGHDTATGKMLAVTDGPRHTEVRRIVAKALTPELFARLATTIRRQIRELVSAALDRDDGCDFGRDIAAAVPLATICDMLAVPAADRPYMHRLGTSSVSSHGPGHSTSEAWTAKNEILAYYLELTEERRAGSGADIVTLLANATVRGRPLGDDEIAFNCYSLILGGDETTRLAMTGGALALAENPAQWQALLDGTVAIDTAVEEVLRWTSPTRHLGRLVTEQAELAGGRVEPGDIVTVWNASANRDEREFGDPDTFRLDRSPNRHVTFAYGPHFCVGARLARIQVEEMLLALRDMVARIEVTGRPGRVYSNFLGGTCNLPVRLVPR